MTTNEKIRMCLGCKNRKMDLQRGTVCSITNEKPNFEDTCPYLIVDTTSNAAYIKANNEESEFRRPLKLMLLMIFAGMIMTVISTFNELREFSIDIFTIAFSIFYCISFIGLGGYALYMFIFRKSNAVFWGYTYFTACFISNVFSLVGNYENSNITAYGIKTVVTCLAWFVFLYYSDNVRDIFPPPEKRKISKREWIISVIGVALPYAYLLIYIFASAACA